jgi:hypothetical protein
MSYVDFFRDNSMVSFLIAFGFLCIQGSGVSTRSVIVILCGIILILTFWCIWTSWRNPEPSNSKPNAKPKRTTLTFEEERVKQKEKGFTFTRKNSDTKSQPTGTKLPDRSSTLSSSFTTAMKKLRRDSSKKAVEEEIEMSSQPTGTKLPDRSRTLSSSFTTALKKLRRDSSKKAEEDIEMSSS